MKKFLKLVLFGILVVFTKRSVCESLLQTDIINSLPQVVNSERRIVVVTASYNNQQWYKRNLDSVFNQNYTNYYIIYVEDCSTDGTYDLVKNYIDEKKQDDRVVLIRNSVRLGTLANLYAAIHQCNNTDIVVIVDGDDWLAHAGVFKYLNTVYSDPNVWLTYGQFKEWPSGIIGFCIPYPQHIVDNNAFRKFAYIPSHLRTFYAGLFKKVQKKDFFYNDNFFPMTADMATMLPMIEMAGSHHRFIPDVLLEYNASNPISDHKVSKELQRECDLVIRNRPVYSRISTPF